MDDGAGVEASERYEDVVAGIDLQDGDGHARTLDREIRRSGARIQPENSDRFGMIECSRER